jgi:hypothetical protein
MTEKEIALVEARAHIDERFIWAHCSDDYLDLISYFSTQDQAFRREGETDIAELFAQACLDAKQRIENTSGT